MLNSKKVEVRLNAQRKAAVSTIPIFQTAFLLLSPIFHDNHGITNEHEQAAVACSKNTPVLHSKTRRALSRRKEGGLVTMKRPNLPFQKCLHCWQKLPWFESAHSWLAYRKFFVCSKYQKEGYFQYTCCKWRNSLLKLLRYPLVRRR